MSGHAGLTKKTITAKGKHGPVKRSYWVRASGAVKGAARSASKLVKKHQGAIKTGAKVAGAVAGAALIAKGAHTVAKNRSAISAGIRGAKTSFHVTGAINKMAGALGMKKQGVVSRLRTAAEDGRATARVGSLVDQGRSDLSQGRKQLATLMARGKRVAKHAGL